MLRAVITAVTAVVVSASAFGLELRGVVLGAGRNPVEGAVVLVRSADVRSLTDARGEFSVTVPDADRIRLEVVHPDYYEREFMVTRRDAGRKLVLGLVPLIRQAEEVTVTALRYPEPVLKVPAAETVVLAGGLEETMPANLTEGIQDVPGVAALGSGGFSLVPTIRGLARRRVLYLVDGARIESDRRTGPNASFLSPEDIGRIEVLRSPASVFYGSDAIGGVIQVMTKPPSFEPGVHGRVNASYGTANGAMGLGVSLEAARKATALSLSLQNIDAGNYRAPGGARILQSQFRQGSLVAKLAHRTDSREVELSFLGARGTNIGKPNANAAVKPTWYPRENQNLVQLHWKEKGVGGAGEILFHAFVNPNFLETRTETLGDGVKTNDAFARTQSTELGAQVSYGRMFGRALRLEGGVDYFGRGGVRARNTYTSFDASGAVTGVQEEVSFSRGRRGDLGFFLSADYGGLKNLDILAGIRLDRLENSALPGTTPVPGQEAPGIVRKTKTTPTGFVAFSYALGRNLTAFINLSRAYRLPSLGELFYTGISGRGTIYGQPGLLPETSFGLDGGLRWAGRRAFAGAYAFNYQIDDMIERYRPDPTSYTYGNIEKGRIRGLEFELEVFPRPGWKLFGNLTAIRGRSLETGSPLNDIPPVRLYYGTRVWAGRFWGEANAAFLFRKTSAGPAEVAIPGSELVNLRAGFSWGRLDLYAVLGNVFNAAFVSRTDPEAMLEPGTSLRAGASYEF